MKIKNIIFITFFIVLIVNSTIKNLNADIPFYKLNAIKLTYKDNNKIIIAEGEAHAKDAFGKEIFSDFIIYDKINNIIKTKSNSKYIDTNGNKIFSENFLYDLNLKKISAKKNVKYQDKNGNIFNFSEFEYYEKSEKGYGKNLKGYLADKSSLEGKFAEIDNKLGTIIIKNNNNKKESFFSKVKQLFYGGNNYTTCENKQSSTNIKEQCPDWSLTTLKTNHDSNSKLIKHNHAIIKIRNIPVFYTPYFSHPDPSVKRKSGLLPASTKNFSDLGRTYKTPYFWAINDNTDILFTPIIYEDENPIYLTEYKKQNENSLIHIDTSYSKGYKNLNKKSQNGNNLNRTGGSRNHIFASYKGSYDDLIFPKNEISININRISQKNYLVVNQINTELVNQDITNLSNNIEINSYRNNEKLSMRISAYENLSIEDPNTKYQYTLPLIEYDNFFRKLNQNISLKNLFQATNPSGDTKSIIQRNTLDVTSDAKVIKKFGIANTLQFRTSNLNYYDKNLSNTSDSNTQNELYTTIALKSSFPLMKMSKTTEESLTPKLFTKYTTGEMNNESNSDKILNYEDIYSMDRINKLDNPETGSSIGYGLDYNFKKKNELDENLFNGYLGVGQVLSDKKRDKMPSKSSLDEKTSNIVSNFGFFLNKEIFNQNKKSIIDQNKLRASEDEDEGLNFKYDFNISNDFDKILKNEVTLNLYLNKNKFNASYYELHDIGNEQYVKLRYERLFANNLNFIAGINKNFENNYTESNFLETNYESDCFKIGLNLSKKFYENNDLQKSNNLTLFVMFKPFGQPFAPDLSSFIDNEKK